MNYLIFPSCGVPFLPSAWFSCGRGGTPERIIRSWVVRIVALALMLSMSFWLRPISHRRQVIASLRGLWDGVTAHMERRY